MVEKTEVLYVSEGNFINLSAYFYTSFDNISKNKKGD